MSETFLFVDLLEPFSGLVSRAAWKRDIQPFMSAT